MDVPPAEADPKGDHYCFERGALKDSGGEGWADVWKRHCFAWEYEGKHADLDAALAGPVPVTVLQRPAQLEPCSRHSTCMMPVLGSGSTRSRFRPHSPAL